MDPGKYIIWFMCDRCSRAYNNVDLLINHKNEAHPEIFRALLKNLKNRGKKRKPEVTFDLSNLGENGADTKTTTELAPKAKRRSIMKCKKEVNENESSGTANIQKKTTPGRRGGRRKSSVVAAEAAEQSNPTLDESQVSPEIPVEGEDAAFVKPDDEIIANDKEVPQKSQPHPEPQLSNSNAEVGLIGQEGKTNVFELLFMQSLKNKKKPSASPATMKSERASSRLSAIKDKVGANSSSEGKYPCPQCSRSLVSPETLKLHMKLHQSIQFISSSKPDNKGESIEVLCDRCGGVLPASAYKCDGCPDPKMVFDFPPVTVKDEPADAAVQPSKGSEASENLIVTVTDSTGDLMEIDVNEPMEIVSVDGNEGAAPQVSVNVDAGSCEPAVE